MKLSRIFLTILLFSSFAYSQGKETFNLQQSVKIALENNPDAIGARAQLSARSAELTSAFGSFLPTITANSRYSRQLNNVQTFIVDGRIISTADAYSINANASWDIFNGFFREANYNRVDKNLESTKYTIQQTEDQVVRDVYRNYITVIRNRQVVSTRQQNLDLGKQELERIKAQYEAGISQIANVYAQEAEIGQREIDLINAENQYNQSKADLLVTMGLNPLAEVDFLDTGIPQRVSQFQIDEFKSQIGTMNGMVNKALANRFDYKAAELNIEAAESNIKMAAASYYPSVSASGGWNWTNSELSQFNEFGTYTVGLNLFVPIFTNFDRNFQVQNAKVNLKQRELDQFRLEQMIRAEIKGVFLNLQSAEKQVEISDKSLKSAQQNYDSVSERFEVGAANITELQVANNQLVNAKINRINAVYSYILAQKEILYTIGEIK
jgi:outer membrane protein